MTRALEARLWLAQRATAMVLAGCVLVHLVTIILAVRGGLSAADMLARLSGSIGWLVFYLVFVIAAAVHGAIGLRTIALEWLGWRGPGRDLAALGFALLLGVLGAHTVIGLCA